ncbi:fructose-2,6-bisphosphatase KNAG_0C02510 [Huiozyma naganishii CBS 8797]|uniref:fructose-2,6-bisphosphate 2-phosphatase n=1 Tax=Huiozyma naganishii (strain ATCC MYA-139 / BCRC 22969 / CBS 8797 / KCTC 17520 / NBRC 10181 / NCYC 3082 / Yp74L-3) TaxID=1071383 RepID=J7RWH9_HUIN7|nr:hypothetical protein KNAG_0C02510 [Kazachstania naganishii CBS 8797]CCK69362.1 hypothetical protein KNAG_0C02510 [Kazachstania naganishii CBS 8797]
MPFTAISNENDLKIVIVMVGLPARGKSYVSQKIMRYLKWMSVRCEIFNVGHYRRKLGFEKPDHEFFDFENDELFKIREEALKLAFNSMVEWFDQPVDDSNWERDLGRVAILDATNSTRERRSTVLELCREKGFVTMFVENWCDISDVIEKNIEDTVKSSPDYTGMEVARATEDFKNRIDNYERVYETLDQNNDADLTFVKLINISEAVVINKIRTYLQRRIVFYVINLQAKPKYIWLSRHGESLYNVEKKIGGDSSLSERGLQYARKLKSIVADTISGESKEHLTVWTSTLIRTQETAQFLPYPKKKWKALDELDAGLCDGMTYEEIEEQYPEDFKARDDDKYEYRYRGGESYRDVVIRLEPIIMEMERQEHVLIITHQAVLRCIYAYFMNVPQEESPWMSIPLHTLIQLETRPYGTIVTRIKANIPAVSTYKKKGTSSIGEIADPNSSSNIIFKTPERA